MGRSMPGQLTSAVVCRHSFRAGHGRQEGSLIRHSWVSHGSGLGPLLGDAVPPNTTETLLYFRRLKWLRPARLLKIKGE
jgi:hypothetical protein